MKSRVYRETTIPSYLTAWPSRDLLRAAYQQATREWWIRHDAFELVISAPVIQECEAGDPDAAAARLATLSGLPLLAVTDEAIRLARDLVAGVPLPPRAGADALHIATAAVHRVDYCSPGTVPISPMQPSGVGSRTFAEVGATGRR